MTLILTCLTKDVVYQVADRRLTQAAPPFEIVDDDANKSVFVDGRLAFGYTGLAAIGGEPTDVWLGKAIGSDANKDMSQVVHLICESATKAFKRSRLPLSVKHHAFQGVGWFRLPGENDWRPGRILIENGIDQRTGSWLPRPRTEFHASTHFPEKMDNGFALQSIGFNPSPEEKRAIWKLVKRCVNHRRATPGAVLKAMLISMRWLSSRHWRIGPGMLAISIPKKSVIPGVSRITTRWPCEAAASALYFSASGTKGSFYGPNIVSGGWVLTNVKGGTVADPSKPFGCR